MNRASRKPRLFIASSTESLPISYCLQENLDYDAECSVWTQGIFAPSRQVLDGLLATMRRMDFAVFVFSPDDVAKIRGMEQRVVRDNVIFELGLFMGHLGPDRCFMVSPRGENLHLPSDLLGLQPLTFDPGRSDANLLAALGAACNTIRRTMELAMPAHPTSDEQRIPTEDPTQKMERLIALWSASALTADREVLRAGIPIWAGEDETGVPTAALERVFAFLNSVADTVLAHPETEGAAKAVFQTAITGVWSAAFTYFSSPSIVADEAWGDHRPPIAMLSAKWGP